jgi:hypothetical protein
MLSPAAKTAAKIYYSFTYILKGLGSEKKLPLNASFLFDVEPEKKCPVFCVHS